MRAFTSLCHELAESPMHHRLSPKLYWPLELTSQPVRLATSKVAACRDLKAKLPHSDLMTIINSISEAIVRRFPASKEQEWVEPTTAITAFLRRLINSIFCILEP
jgi:hypothetical protein